MVKLINYLNFKKIQIFLNQVMAEFLRMFLEQNYKTTHLEIVSLDQFYIYERTAGSQSKSL